MKMSVGDGPMLPIVSDGKGHHVGHFSLEGAFPLHPPTHRQKYPREMLVESESFRLEKTSRSLDLQGQI